MWLRPFPELVVFVSNISFRWCTKAYKHKAKGTKTPAFDSSVTLWDPPAVIKHILREPFFPFNSSSFSFFFQTQSQSKPRIATSRWLNKEGGEDWSAPPLVSKDRVVSTHTHTPAARPLPPPDACEVDQRASVHCEDCTARFKRYAFCCCCCCCFLPRLSRHVSHKKSGVTLNTSNTCK